jgi:hypothetical protein
MTGRAVLNALVHPLNWDNRFVPLRFLALGALHSGGTNPASAARSKIIPPCSRAAGVAQSSTDAVVRPRWFSLESSKLLQEPPQWGMEPHLNRARDRGMRVSGGTASG